MLPPRARRLFQLAVRRRARLAREVDDEIAFHLEARAAQLIARAMSPDDARAEALRRFGDVDDARQTLNRSASRREARMHLREVLANSWQDIRYAARGIRRSPGFSAAVIITLALGIGANATMFGVVDRLLLRPPAHLRAPGEVNRVYLTTSNGFMGLQLGSNQSYRRYMDLVQNTHATSDIAAHYERERVFGLGEAARQERTSMVTASFWSLFGVRPALGRFFNASEDQLPQGTPVAVLGYGYWQSQFGGRTDVLGRIMRIGGVDYTIIGVAPSGFNGLSLQSVAAYIPLTAGAADFLGEFGPRVGWSDQYRVGWLQTIVRRKPGVSVEAATADMTNAFRQSLEIQRQVQPTGPLTVSEMHPQVTLGSVLESRGPRRSQSATVSLWLMAVSGLVLLMACANVANLLIARALRRRREIAIRQAIGVSRGRLLAQLLTESTLLALLGGVAGVLVARWGGALLRTVLLPNLDWSNGMFDHRVLLFAGVVALGAGLITGLAPIRQLASTDVAGALRNSGRGTSVRGSRLRKSLLVAQGAVSVVLLVGAGLFVRSFHNVRSLDLGFQPEHVLIADVTARGTPIDSVQRDQLAQQMRERALTVPGVEHATSVLTVPFASEWTQPIIVPGVDTTGMRELFSISPVGADYFATMGTRLLRGRPITDADRAGSGPVVVVSQSAAQRIWAGADPMGRCIKLGGESPCMTVVGVAQDIRASFNDEPALQMYVSIAQQPQPETRLFIRTRGDAANSAEPVRRALQQLMPGAAYVDAQPLEDVVAEEFRSWRLGATMFTIFGILALVVAAVGLYSVVAYDVSQRTQELGVRVALGASAGAVIRLVLAEGVRVVALGFVLGALVALAFSTRVTPLLYHTSGKDPLAYAGVVAVLLAVALVASLAPALRASRVDPNVALRME
jgi:predicted permease